jgi:hypothetical protein
VETREPHPIPELERDRQGRLLALAIERAAMRCLGQLSVEDETLTGGHASALLISVLVLQASNVAVQSALPLDALQEALRRAYQGVIDEHAQHQDRPVPGPA